MQIELWPIDKPIPYNRNARKLTDKAISKVAESLSAFGWKQPLVVDAQGEVIVGHTRLAAAKRLGLAEVPVLVAADLTPEQARQYRLMDNRAHDETDWDLDVLSWELSDMSVAGIDLGLTGFTDAQIEAALRLGRQPDEEDALVADAGAQPTSQPGDMWTLGAHRVLCGDATSEADVRRLLDGAMVPGLMVTDPPYGVEYDPAWRENHNTIPSFRKTFTTGNRKTGAVQNDHEADWAEAYRLFPGAVAYVWHDGVHAATVAANLRDCGFEIRAQIIWKKQSFVFGRGAYHWGHEPCWYAVRKGAKANWRGDRKQSTVWEVANMNPMGGNRDEDETNHSTQKPLELMRRPITNHTKRGEAVYDPFLGSGTTIMAAEDGGRIGYGLEINPVYVDMIVQRWQRRTGQAATLAGDGRTFDEVAKDRTPALAVVA